VNTYQIAFKLFSTLVTPVWLLMIFAPRWPTTHKIIKSLWIVVPFVLAYAVLELPSALPALALFVRPNLPDIMKLLGSESGATLAWLHFIAADLFVGRWVYLDSREHNMNVWLMGPILFLNSMLCPLGFVLYLIARKLTVPTAAMA
jgi:hypothetical protein